MFTSHDGRGRQIARTLIIAAASAALAGSATALAGGTGGTGGSGGTPAPAKRVARAGDCVKPDPGGKPDRGPLSADDPILQDAKTRLQALVTAGTAGQAEVDAVLAEVTAGSVNLDALVQAGTLTAAHAEAIDAVLKDIKNAHAGDKAEGAKPAAAATARRAKAARGI